MIIKSSVQPKINALSISHNLFPKLMVLFHVCFSLPLMTLNHQIKSSSECVSLLFFSPEKSWFYRDRLQQLDGSECKSAAAQLSGICSFWNDFFNFTFMTSGPPVNSWDNYSCKKSFFRINFDNVGGGQKVRKVLAGYELAVWRALQGVWQYSIWLVQYHFFFCVIIFRN